MGIFLVIDSIRVTFPQYQWKTDTQKHSVIANRPWDITSENLNQFNFRVFLKSTHNSKYIILNGLLSGYTGGPLPPPPLGQNH